MNDPITITLNGIFWTLAITAIGLIMVIVFDKWSKRDLKKQERANKKEIDRLLSLDEHERKIS